MPTASHHPLVSSFARAWRNKHGDNHTLTNYLGRLRSLERYLDASDTSLTDATLDDLEGYLEMRLRQVEPATVHVDYRAIRAFYKFLLRREHIASNPARHLEGPVVPEPVVVHATEDDYRRVLADCRRDRTRQGKRDAAMFALIFWTGMRRGELPPIDVGHVDLDEGVLTIPETKGGEPRVVGLPNEECVDLLDRWLHARGWEPGPLFTSRTGTRLTATGISQTYQKRRARVGVSVGLHGFRHHRATEWAKGSRSEVLMMANFGWRSSKMAKRYIGKKDQALAVAEAKRLFSNKRGLRAVAD